MQKREDDGEKKVCVRAGSLNMNNREKERRVGGRSVEGYKWWKGENFRVENLEKFEIDILNI